MRDQTLDTIISAFFVVFFFHMEYYYEVYKNQIFNERTIPKEQRRLKEVHELRTQSELRNIFFIDTWCRVKSDKVMPVLRFLVYLDT